MASDYASILQEFGTTLRQIRKEKRLSLVDVSITSGLDQGDISRIERGQINFSYSTLYKLAIGLEMHPAQLLSTLPWNITIKP